MKKVLATILTIAMLVSLFAIASFAAEPALVITPDDMANEDNTFGNCAAEVQEEGGIEFAHVETSGDDPWIVFKEVPTTDAANKYAVIKYRTNADDSCGTGAFYTKIAEPHVEYELIKDGEWHTTVVDLSVAAAVNGGGANTNWDGAFMRMDILNGAPVLNPGQEIDIAYVAFFADEAEATAYANGAASEATGLVNPADYDVSYFIDKTNATNWSNGNIGEMKVTYYFKVEDDGLAIGVVADGLDAGNYVQLNFNPGNYLWDTTGQFVSFVLGDTLTALQHNHANGLLDDPAPGGADITSKVNGQIVKTASGYEFTAKLPKEIFTITDVAGADAFVYGQDDLYFGMFLVAGGGGLTNQATAPGSDWTCKGLNLNEYVFEGQPEPATQPTTGDMTVAMFAVIAVLALGAAVVFAKKRAF